MSRQVSRDSAGEYQAHEQAGVASLRCPVSGRGAGRWRTAQLATIRRMSRQVSRGLAGEYQADEQAGVARHSWRVSVMIRQVSRGSAGEYQADEQAGVARLSWRVSGR